MAETLQDWLREHPPPESALRQTLAGVARRALAGEPFMTAVREFLDEWALRPSDASRASAIADAPQQTGDARHDAYLGALAEHLAARHGLERPAWSIEPDRFLETFWFHTSAPGLRATTIVQSPAAFRRRGIFIGATSLDRC